MNIFVLDTNPRIAATYHCDQHVVKMILESAQLLCTASYQHGHPAPYRPTHAKHPCTLWTAESRGNWDWLVALAYGLNNEYKLRYGHNTDHKSWRIIEQLDHPPALPDRGLTSFVQAMPDQYKVPGDPVAAYRAFYCGDKASFATWRYSPPPEWFVQQRGKMTNE